MPKSASIASVFASPTKTYEQKHAAALALIRAEARVLDEGMAPAARAALGRFVCAFRSLNNLAAISPQAAHRSVLRQTRRVRRLAHPQVA